MRVRPPLWGAAQTIGTAGSSGSSHRPSGTISCVYVFFSPKSKDFIEFFQFLGSFEVTVNGKLVFSKLERGGFPDFDEVKKSQSINQSTNENQFTSLRRSCTHGQKPIIKCKNGDINRTKCFFITRFSPLRSWRRSWRAWKPVAPRTRRRRSSRAVCSCRDAVVGKNRLKTSFVFFLRTHRSNRSRNECHTHPFLLV